MHRITRYGLSLFVAGGIIVLASTVTDSVLLLAGIGKVYAVGTAIVLRPEMRQIAKDTSGTPQTIFNAVTVFSVLVVAQSFSSEFHFGLAIFAYGLAFFGLFCGMWAIVETEP